MGHQCHRSMPANKLGYKFIIMAIGFFALWPMAQAIKHHNTKAIRWFIEQKIIGKFGTPKRIMTNCSKELVSNNMKLYYEGKYVNHIPTTPYHTQGNRQVERLKIALLEILHKLCTINMSSGPQKLTTDLMVVQSKVN